MITNTIQKEKTFVLPIIFDQNVCGEREILRMHFFTFQKEGKKNAFIRQSITMITNTIQKEKTFVLPIIFDQNVCGEREILRMHFFTFQKEGKKNAFIRQSITK